MPQVIFGGIPRWLLSAYLAELGGVEAPDGSLRGQEWTATLVADGERIGGFPIGRVTVDIEGRAAAEVMAALRRKALRGGG